MTTTAQETETQETKTMNDANTLVITRTLPARPEWVFEAFTRGEIAKQWMSPGTYAVPEVEIDARVGGSYRIVMEGPEDQTYSPSGVYEEVVPNEKLVYTWKWAHEELVTRFMVELKPIGDDQTELTLTHTGFVDTEQHNSHKEGWIACMDKLEAAVA